ncbi:MAG: GNAT family N-acetyltransferase [Pyrinomonadaceae bacterium]
MSNEESTASPLDFCRIDSSFDTTELLQRIEEILVEGDSHNAASFSEKKWTWQYKNLLTGDARIYVCVCDGKIVGYYHVPVYEGVVNNEKKNFAMVQDVAVSATMRGRSVFRKLAEFATNDLVNSDINLIYTFPNQKSIHTFLKYNGYKQIYTYDSYILPVATSAIIKSKLSLFGFEKPVGWLADKYFDLRNCKMAKGSEVKKIDQFDEEIAGLFHRFNSNFLCHLNRTKNYLQWRFFNKPIGKHFLITLQNDSKTLAAAVFKLDEILGTNTAIVLDFAFEGELHLAQLLHFVRKNSMSLFDEKISMIFTACCCDKFLQNKTYGLIKIPQRFNPRPLNLLVRNITEDEREVLKAQNWLALLSDWDVL